MELTPGLKGSANITVTQKETAAEVGSGLLPVFSTPSMIALAECAACNAISSFMTEGITSVGTSLNIRHIAATPIGMNVRADATLTETDGRRLVFDIKVYDDKELIGEGTHERFTVSADRFLKKANAKTSKIAD